jgi:hypothetical protein
LLRESDSATTGCLFLPFGAAALFFGAEELPCREFCPNDSITFDDAVELLGRPWEETVATAGVSVVGATPRYIEE